MISLNILYFYDFIIIEVCLVFSLFCEMVMFAFELYCAHSFLWLALVHLYLLTTVFAPVIRQLTIIHDLYLPTLVWDKLSWKFSCSVILDCHEISQAFVMLCDYRSPRRQVIGRQVVMLVTVHQSCLEKCWRHFYMVHGQLVQTTGVFLGEMLCAVSEE